MVSIMKNNINVSEYIGYVSDKNVHASSNLLFLHLAKSI